MLEEPDYVCKFSTGDVIRVECPGTALHGCYGLIVKTIVWPYESDCEVLLSNPPKGTPKSIMLRDKWLKIISKIKAKSS